MPSNLTIINSTNPEQITAELYRMHVKGAHFTNGTYAPPAKMIVPTTLAGFKHVTKLYPQLPIIVATNSDESMRCIGKTDFESQDVRAKKVAEPLAEMFPNNKIIILFYDEATPNNLYKALKGQGHTRTLHKWGYGTTPDAPKIEGAEFFEHIYAYPLPNEQKPVCWNETPGLETQQTLIVEDLRGRLIAADGVLFEVPESLRQHQSASFTQQSLPPATLS